MRSAHWGWAASAHVLYCLKCALQPGHIDIAEQNVHDTVWPDGQRCSRRLRLRRQAVPVAAASSAGSLAGTGAPQSPGETFTVEDTFRDTRILGWMSYVY